MIHLCLIDQYQIYTLVNTNENDINDSNIYISTAN